MSFGYATTHNEGLTRAPRARKAATIVSTEPIADEVVVAAQQGDAGALRAVYLSLAPAVLGYLRGKGVDDAEAVTSDVFLALFAQLGRVRGGGAGLRKLTFSIAHARMVDEHRARSRRPPAVPFEERDDTRVVASAEDGAHAGLATERVLEILDLLPADQREVLTLRIIADLSVEQVAEIIGRSSGAVKQLQHRGLLTVRRVLVERRVTL